MFGRIHFRRMGNCYRMTEQRRSFSRRALLGTLGSATLLASLGSATHRSRGSGCPGAEHLSAPAPGPDVLYEDPVEAENLAPGGRWTADPLLVSGGQAHVDGEYVYQGWLHDDYGAAVPEETGTESPVETSLDEPEGDLVYPTDEDRYGHNAADLVEIRAKPTDDGVAYRFVLNTVLERDAAIVALGIATGGSDAGGGDGDGSDWGHGLGDLGAAVDRLLVTWGTGAELDGEALDDERVSLDVERNRLEVEVPLDPGGETWTHYAVAGIHDGDGGFAPVQPQPDERHPGGALSDVPPVFDVGFRLHDAEPLVDPDMELAVSWRELAQAEALADRDISSFGAEIDFGALRDGERIVDVPEAGYINRLYASRASFDEGDEGVNPESRPLLLGDVQPYSIYVPESYDHADPEPAPLVVLPHSLGQNYNQYAGTENLLRQLGEERDAIVLMFEGRGPDGWWREEGEFDLFEAWADAASRYEIDFDRVTIAGYSMGGYGTFRLASLYPDLFGAGFPVVPPSDEDVFGGPTRGEVSSDEETENTQRVTDNVRHVPLLVWAGTNDELVPYAGVRNHRRQLADHGYRHRLDTFAGLDHFALFFLDEWGPAQTFLEDREVERRPGHVTYRTIDGWDSDGFPFSYDGAYWVQDIETADGADEGLVDALALTDGHDEPVAEEFADGGTDPSAHTREGVRWRYSTPELLPENSIELDLEGVGAVTLYVDDAGIDATAPLTVRSDSTHEVEITLRSGAGEETVELAAGESEETVTLCERASGHGEKPKDVGLP